ncbi:cation:proton antiporter domain-containing protein [Sorlinia euscelidii]|uniref:Cation/H+ exchanger transmembrane domain-containing protein n=1 Tax=Sorlinia euscelidii TaxID=3081148 RepID=A0ABU7U1Y1_9PROT
MTSLGLFASLLCLATLLGIVNARTLKLPDTIGILLYALCLSIFIRVLDTMMPQLDLHSLPSRIIALADLPGNLLNGALSFLLFAGALHVDVEQIARKKWQVGALAIIGTILSVGFLSGAMWLGGNSCMPICLFCGASCSGPLSRRQIRFPSSACYGNLACQPPSAPSSRGKPAE